jgi:hypothetical protein
MSYILVKDKLYEQFTSANITGFRESSTQLPVYTAPPPARWLGSKIPLSVWREILAFFKWSYDTTKSETQVRLFHHPSTGEWRAHAFPQVKNSGMTTREIEDHPHKTEDNLLFAGWDNRGTVHHQCSCSAFQSGTDRSDESNQPGLHLTVGSMDKSKHDLHARIVAMIPGELDIEGKLKRSAQTLQFEARLADWFALPDELARLLPEALHTTVLEHYMTSAATSAEVFPDRWRENLVERPAYVYPGCNFQPHQAALTLRTPGTIAHLHDEADILDGWESWQLAAMS